MSVEDEDCITCEDCGRDGIDRDDAYLNDSFTAGTAMRTPSSTVSPAQPIAIKRDQ
jgi:hypothetical protein